MMLFRNVGWFILFRITYILYIILGVTILALIDAEEKAWLIFIIIAIRQIVSIVIYNKFN